jgi:hypothetical protein
VISEQNRSTALRAVILGKTKITALRAVIPERTKITALRAVILGKTKITALRAVIPERSAIQPREQNGDMQIRISPCLCLFLCRFKQA